MFDVGGYPWTWGIRERAKRHPFAPHVAAAGPLLSTLDFWLNLPGERQFIYLEDEDSARAGVRYLAARGTDAVKVWFIPMQNRDFDATANAVMAAGRAAAEAGVSLIVHATGMREAKVALRAGARLLVHSVRDGPVDDEFIDLARKNGTIYCPTLTVAGGYSRMYSAARSGSAPTIDDPNRCVDETTKQHIARTGELGRGRVEQEDSAGRKERAAESRRIMAENLARVHGAGIPIAMGTDAGNPLTLHGPSVYAEMEAMQAAGMAPLDVLVASTRGGALAMGRDDIGTIEAGKIADLVIVGADPAKTVVNLRQLAYVVRGGVLRTIDELRSAPR